MITNFEEITFELTEEEHELKYDVIRILKQHDSENVIKAPDLIAAINYKHEEEVITGARLRKIINYIRSNSLLPVIATSKGYFVSYDKEVIASQIQSLKDRSNAILTAAKGLYTFNKDDFQQPRLF